MLNVKYSFYYILIKKAIELNKIILNNSCIIFLYILFVFKLIILRTNLDITT